jgi:alpha-L-rhamnosidase
MFRRLSLLTVCVLACESLAFATVSPGQLQCEYRTSPTVDTLQPRLSWLVNAESGKRKQSQSAYQILVADSLAALEKNEGHLWDTGRTASNQSTQIVYAGKPLVSGKQYFWKVRLWDQDGKESSWSKPATWSMGLLDRSDWKAKWIGMPPRQSAYFPTDYLRKPFSLKATPRHATVYVTAAGLYELRLNGDRVGDALFTPGWTQYDKRLYYQAYDVTPLLRAGENVIGAILADGWYGLQHQGRGRLGLLAQLCVEYPDGSREQIVTDGSWKITEDGPVRMADFYQGETYDARMAMPGWDASGFDDAGWLTATTDCFRTKQTWPDVTQKVREAVQNNKLAIDVSTATFGGDPACGRVKTLRVKYRLDGKQENKEVAEGQKLTIDGQGKPLVIEKAEFGVEVVMPSFQSVPLQVHPGSPVRKIEEIKPVKLTEPKPGKWTFDLGQNFSGWARLKVRGAAGTQIVLRFAEALNPDGTIYTANLRAAKATDTYTLRGGEEETWEPQFTFHGFRYVELTGLPGKPDMDAITGVVLHSDGPRTSSFACSNPMLNQLYRNIVWGQRSNYLEVPTDCPQRDERMGWTGDAQAFIGTAAYNMDIAPFFSAWMRTLNDCQSAEGAFPDIAPCHGGMSPGWGDAGVICPWTIYRVYGDRRMLEECYPNMVRWIDLLQRKSDHCVRPEQGYGDWLNVRAGLPKDVIATAYFAYVTSLMEKTANVLGKTDDAARFHKLLDRIKAAFQKAFVAADGRIKGHTQTAYLMALGFDLLSPEQRPLAVNHLVSLIEERNRHLSTGFLGVNLLLPVLTQIGRNDLAYVLLQNETFPSWGYSVKHGATTIWERWDGWTEERGFQDPVMNSFNHYAYGSCGQWMFASMAGIDTDGPGYQRIMIHPRIGGGITYVKSRYDSIRGPISVNWALQGDRLQLDAAIPANTTATIFVPAKSASDVKESGVLASEAPGVKFLRFADDAAIYRIDSGEYHFVSTKR